ncbi:MAG: class I SAM-dependent DNA methyltransferase, partial [Thermoanaerobaculia bacterium]
MKKRYDRAYFDRWYRGAGSISTAKEVRRKVTMAVAIAEFFLRRSIRSVLDVGCGEAVWFEHLRSLRPRVSYTGIEASEYAVETFGRERNIHRGSVGELTALDTSRQYDLVVCADVLHYVSDSDVRHGIAAMSRLSRGLVYLEVLTAEDDIVGDLQGFNRRPARWYRQIALRNGMSFVGPYCWLSADLRDSMAE